MVNVPKFLKPYKDAGALHCLLPINRFVDDNVFLTKRNQLGVVLQVEGIDDECHTAEMLESCTRRIAAAWRSFDERFRIYQYVVKQDLHNVEPSAACCNNTARETIRRRTQFLESKEPGLYSIRLFLVILLEPAVLNSRSGFQRSRPSGRRASI